MPSKTLTVVDVAGIQEYIFGSNDLGQNMGASELVVTATSDWIFQALTDSALKHNGHQDSKHKFGNWSIEPTQPTEVDALVIYAGGGNAVILFDSMAQSQTFVTRLTTLALRNAPELQIVCVHEEFDWETGSATRLDAALAQARQRLGQRGESIPVSMPLLGLGVSAACDFTARPVYGLDEEGAPISRGVHAKLNYRDQAQDRLWRVLQGTPGLEPSDWFIRNFDEFGQARESSYIAVIHADGNGMGERIKRHVTPTVDCSTYINNLRDFSASIERAAQQALRSTVAALLATRKRKNGKEYFGRNGEIETRPGRLPFRPLVFGGDDVTFVCDGRLGLALAHTYLKALETHAPKLSDQKPLYSRAGVAVVKNHYPFSRAYRIANDLTATAKLALEANNDRMALDWHFATSGTLLELDDLRQREYTARDNRSLLMRPLRLKRSSEADWRTWSVFRYFANEFMGNDPAWLGRRNKVKALRDALRAGPEQVKQFLQNYQPPDKRHLPQLAGYEALSLTGWEDGPDGRCGYFDAIEATDFFVELEAGS